MPDMPLNHKNFLKQQLQQWPLAAKNFNDLKDIEVREVELDGNSFRLQLNPHRIVSSAAKIDAKSIQERPCFLCKKNRPDVQIEDDLEDNFTFLVNPFPIFSEHFTIPIEAHIPQELNTHLEKGMQLALQMPELLFFYNGARCGASAPDHFHFQAGNRGFLPLELAVDNKDFSANKIISTKQNSSVLAVNDNIRNYIIISGNCIDDLVDILQKTIKHLQGKEPDEPRFNLLFWSNKGEIKLVFIPRSAHRPSQYNAEGDESVMFSPAAVEMGGVCVFARREDYDKMNSTLLKDMLQQVVYPNMQFKNLCNQLQNTFR